MKQKKGSLYLIRLAFVVLLSLIMFLDTRIYANQPIWNISFETYKKSATIESKICAFEVLFEQDFPETFTAIQPITDKVCSVESIVELIDSGVDQDLLDVQSILSKVDIIDQTVINVSNTINDIRVSDFGGTWTALDALEQNLCDKFESSFDSLTTIESSIDQLTADNLDQFIATFTKLEILATDVFNTMTLVQDFADQLESDLAGVESLIDIVKVQLTSIDSKIEVLDIDISQNFSATFTAIDCILEKLCDADNKIDQIDVSLDTDSAGTFTALKAVENKVCTVVSKVDVIGDIFDLIKDKVSIIDEPLDCSLIDVLTIDLFTINSKVDVIVNKVIDLNSQLDVIEITSNTVVEKLCTIESAIDLVDGTESLIDLLNMQFITIESKVDISNIAACTVESKLCVIDTQLNLTTIISKTVESSLEVIEINTETIESLVDIIDITVSSVESKLCVIDEKVDIIDSSLDVVCNTVEIVDSKIEVVESVVEVVLVEVQTVESSIDIVDSKVATVVETLYTIESKLCTIDPTLITINSSVDVINTNLVDTTTLVNEAFEDFNETWTMLQFFQDKVCIVDSKADVVNSLIDFIDNLNMTFTAIEQVLSKSCDVVTAAHLLLNDACKAQGEFSTTFTIQDEILEKLCETSSQLDEISLSTTVLDPIQSCLGTAIRQDDVGTAGFTISTEGRYYLAENIDFAPGVASAIAITISADRVYLDLNGKTLSQTDGSSNVSAIVSSGARRNISIVNGIIRSFSGDGIRLGSPGSVDNALLDDLLIADSGGTTVPADACIKLFNTNNAVVKNSTISRAGASNMIIFTSENIFIERCYCAESNRFGIYLLDTSGVCIRECTCFNHQQSAIELEAFFSDVSGVLVESCTLMNNQFGVRFCTSLGSTVSDVVVRDNIITGNIDSGISMRDPRSGKRCVFMNNVISNNLGNGIFLSRDDTICNNVFLFNSLVQNESANFREEADFINGGPTGPNTVLGNFAYHSSGDSANYITSLSTVNKVVISQSGAFPTTIPTHWHNISMTP